MIPVRQSAKARLHSRMLLGLCNEGFLVIATITARLLRNAKVAKGPLTTARIASLMYAAVSFLAIPIQPGNPQIEPFSFVLILSVWESELMIYKPGNLNYLSIRTRESSCIDIENELPN